MHYIAPWLCFDYAMLELIFAYEMPFYAFITSGSVKN